MEGNNGDKNIYSIFCISLILISFKLCADPNNLNFLFKLYELKFNSLLKDGI